MKKSAIVLFAGIALLLTASTGGGQTIQEIIDKAPAAGGTSDQAAALRPNTPESVRSGTEVFYAIQAGTYPDEKAAEQKVTELKQMGYDPYVFQTLGANHQTVYAVRIGKYDDYPSAAGQMAKMPSDIKGPMMITRYDSLEPAAPPSIAPVVATAAAAVSRPPSPAAVEKPPAVAKGLAPAESGSEAPPTLQSLEEKINSLETQVQNLRDAAEVRKNLQKTEEEQSQEEKDILEAAGEQYTLTRGGNIEFTYGFHYEYSDYDAIRESVRVEEVANHTLSNSLRVMYGVKDNLSVGASIPFVYKYNRVGTVDSKDVTGLGDLSLNWQFQPIKSSRDFPTIIINGNFAIPEGKGPYKIQYGKELSTGDGFYSTSIGASISQVSDPVLVFSSVSFSYPFSVTDINQKRPEGVLEEVDPGPGLGISAGLAYALSYKLNLNASVGYSYSFDYKYRYQNAGTANSGTYASADINLGVGYKLNRTQNLNFRVGLPLAETQKFTFSFSMPIEFEL